MNSTAVSHTHEDNFSHYPNTFKAPDGSVWFSKEEYDSYMETISTNSKLYDNGYLAPDGNYWTSKEEYDKYLESLTEQCKMR